MPKNVNFNKYWDGIFRETIFFMVFSVKSCFKGLRSDLYNNLPAKIGLKIFGSVLNTSLSILAVR